MFEPRRLHMKRISLLLLSLLLSCGSVAWAQNDANDSAQNLSSENLVELLDRAKWVVDVGAFYANVDSNIRIDGARGNLGTTLDFESDLGLTEREALFNASISYLGWDRWIIGAEWFELNRNASASLQRDITWGTTLVPLGAQADTYFNVNIVRLLAGYELYRTDRTRAGASIGVHGAGMEAGIDARFDVGNGTLGRFESEADTGAILPLPNLGLWAHHAFTDRLIGGVRIDAFALEIDEYRGSLISAGANLRYRATEKFSIGLGYSYFDLEVSMDRRLWDGKARFSYHGPRLFAFYAW
jgi:hypothetical protein